MNGPNKVLLTMTAFAFADKPVVPSINDAQLMNALPLDA